MHTLLQDLRYALRQLRKSPGFAITVVLTLALGIGANTAIFTLAKQVLFDTLAVPHPQQLKLLRWIAPHHSAIHRTSGGDVQPTTGGETTGTAFPYPFYEHLRRQGATFQHLFAFQDIFGLTVAVRHHAISVRGEMVSGNFFQTLEVQPILGRAIMPADNAVTGSGAVAVISYGFWTTQLGRSPDVIGKTIDIDAMPMTIIGVAPRGFTGASDAHLASEVFFPFSMQPVISASQGGSRLEDNTLWWVDMMVRTQSSASVRQIQARMDTALQSWLRTDVKPNEADALPHLHLVDGSRGLKASTRSLNQPVYVLSALAGLVLLLACANIANLLLARATRRRREIGMRLALGARRTRVVRQMLTESLLLSAAGGAAGVCLAYTGRNLLPWLMSTPGRPVIFHGRFDLRVLAFAAAISMLTGLIFGMAPAWHASSTDVNAELKTSHSGITPRRAGFASKGIVSFQIALSTLLIAGALLFGRTLMNLESVNPGFRTDHLLLFNVQLPASMYPPPKDVQVLRELERKLATVPGVQSATLADDPLIANDTSQDSFIRLDHPPRPGSRSSAWDNSVGKTYFSTMGIPILRGRGFNSVDTPGSLKVAVINEALAREFFPHSNPIGKQFRGYFFVDKVPFTIVGICGNTHYHNLRLAAPPTYYVLYSQLPHTDGEMTFAVRTYVSPDSLLPAIRRTVASVDSNLPLLNVRTQAEQIDATLQSERLLATLTTAFGILALLLACTGVYGIMAYSVSQRTHEMGIRIALGSPTGAVIRNVLAEAIWMMALGTSLGLAAALIASHAVSSMLFDLKSWDPPTMAGAALLLLLITLAASLLPARRAASVDPMQALRSE